MKVKILAAVLLVSLLAAPVFAGAQARNLELVDVPTANTMTKGELRYDTKFYPGGGILNRLYVSIFDRFIIGCSVNVMGIIGSGDIVVDLPIKFNGKARLSDDEGPMPAIAIGYEGQGYMGVREKGLYVAVTKEAYAGPVVLQLTGTLYTNEFSQFGNRIDAGLGFAAAFTREFMFSFEFDGITRANETTRISFGTGYFFDPIELALGFKYNLDTFEFARFLKILYVAYF